MAYRFKHGDRPVEGYTIQRAVGSGGFGEVYYAISDGGREVALKYLRDNPQVELRGISHCINLKSPHLVSIFDVKKSEDGEFFVVMEYCSGPSLRDLLIAEPNGFATEKAAFFTREIAKGLAYLHDRGIVHRDLKPGNIFFDDGYVKIGDYGLSKFISVSRHSAQTASVGTVHYMAPEIGSGNYQRGVDIYALGVMLYEMLLGKVPFEGSTMGEVLMKHLMSQPQVDNLPDPFAHVIRKALEKDPKDRYQTVDVMITEMLSGEAVQKSLAGFSPDSLSGAVRRGTADPQASPMPSPNPTPPRARIVSPQEVTPVGGPLPDSVSQRINRISRKLDQRVAKLGGKVRAWGTVDRKEPADESGEKRAKPARRIDILPPGNRTKRIGLAILVTTASSFAVGVLIGNTYNDEIGVAAGMLVAAMVGAVPATRKVINWLSTEFQPDWAKRLASAACGAPLVFIGAAPAIDRWGEEGVALALSLLAVIVFGDWSKDIDRGSVGELSIGSAIWKGVGAFLASLPLSFVLGGDPDKFMLIAGLVTVVSCLTVQACSWWLRNPSREAPPPSGPKSVPTGDTVVVEPATHRRNVDMTITSVPAPGASAHAVEPEAPERPEPFDAILTRAASVPPGMVRRGNVTRMFWAVAAFVAMCGALITLLVAVLWTGMDASMRPKSVIACIGFSCALIFSLARTAPLRPIGLWGGFIRPVLLTLTLFVMGTSIVMMTQSANRMAWDVRDRHARSLVKVKMKEYEAAAAALKAAEFTSDCEEAERSSKLVGVLVGPGILAEPPPPPPAPPAPPAAPSELAPPSMFDMGPTDFGLPSRKPNPATLVALVVSFLVLMALIVDPIRRRRNKHAPGFMKSDPGDPPSQRES